MRKSCASGSVEKRILYLRYLRDIQKEIFRKTIHLCTVLVPFLLNRLYVFTLVALCLVLIIYIIAEILRMHGRSVPVLTTITMVAARKRDETKIVWGPITLCIGVIVTAIVFKNNPQAFSMGILSLACGDGVASVVGKIFGKTPSPFGIAKTVEGSIACFIAIFFVGFFYLDSTISALILATIGMIVEMFPTKDFDNILIPIIIAFFVEFLF